jgi:hypothetical protein
MKDRTMTRTAITTVEPTETAAPAATAALPAQPVKGGSYSLDPATGSLVRVAGTEPAEPKLGAEPQPTL